MEEMTIQEKARRYDRAIEELRGMMPNWERLSYNGKTFLQDFTHILPELKESEDEKIRQYLLKLADRCPEDSIDFMGEVKKEDVIAWLKKQGEKEANGNNREIPFSEQKHIDKVEPKFKAGDIIISTLSNIPYYITEVCNGYYLTDIGCIIMFNAQDNFELSKQKTTWSEEDTERYISCLQHLGTGNLEQPETINSKWFKEHIKIPAQVQRVIAL